MKKIFFFSLICYSLSIFAQQPDAVFIDPSGNVGIGTITPKFNLHVQGSLQADSAIGSNYAYFKGAQIDYATIPKAAITEFANINGAFLKTATITTANITDANVSGNLIATKPSSFNSGISIGTLNYDGPQSIAFNNTNHQWNIWTNGSQPSEYLEKNSFTLWEYNGTKEGVPRIVVEPSTETIKSPPTLMLDAVGNLWVTGDVLVHRNYNIPKYNKDETGNHAENAIKEYHDKTRGQSILQLIDGLHQRIEELEAENENIKKRMSAFEGK